MPENIIYNTVEIAKVIVEQAAKAFPTYIPKPFSYPQPAPVDRKVIVKNIPSSLLFSQQPAGVKFIEIVTISKFATQERTIGAIARYGDNQFIYVIDDESFREKITSIVKEISMITRITFTEIKRRRMTKFHLF